MKRIIAVTLACMTLCACTSIATDVSSDYQGSSENDVNVTDSSSDITNSSSKESDIVSSEDTSVSSNSSITTNTSSDPKTNMSSGSNSVSEPTKNTINECEVFSDLFRTDYIYNQSDYCSDGKNIYLSGNPYIVYDTVTRKYSQISLGDGYQTTNPYIYNGYLTAHLESSNYTFIYDLSSEELIIIDGVYNCEAAFVYGDYIYVKYATGSPEGGLIQRSLIKTEDRKWETIAENVFAEFIMAGKYLFGNRGESKQMFRVDLSTGEVYDYNNGIVFENFSHFQNDNWIMTNKGIFDVSSNSIKYANENYYIVGNVGVKFDVAFIEWEQCLKIELLNFKTGDMINKIVKIKDGQPMGNSVGVSFATKGCTYNGLYINDIFLRYTNDNDVLGFETIVGPENFINNKMHNSLLGNYDYGCLFVLNDYYYYVNANTAYKSPLSDINQKTKLLGK